MCPFCDHSRSRVLLTENFGSFIRRRRRCAECQGQFYTTEERGGIIKPPKGWKPPERQLALNLAAS